MSHPPLRAKLLAPGEIFRRSRQRQRGIRRLVVQERHRLRRGIFLVGSSGARLLGAGRGHRLRDALARGRRIRGLRDARRLAIEAVMAHPRPSLYLNLSGMRSGASEILPSAEGCRILLAADHGWAARVADEPIFTEAYRDLRSEFGAHVDSPSFEIAADGRVVTERFISGVPLSKYATSVQLEIAERIIVSYVSLCEHATRPATNAGAAMRLFDEAPPELREVLSREEWWRLAVAAPLTPSHGDAVSKNYLIQDTGAYLLDWEPAFVALRPFWFDAMTIFRKNEGLARHFAAGDLDMAFARLWSASGIEPVDLAASRRTLLAAWCLVAGARSVDQRGEVPATGDHARVDDASAIASWRFWEDVLADLHSSKTATP